MINLAADAGDQPFGGSAGRPGLRAGAGSYSSGMTRDTTMNAAISNTADTATVTRDSIIGISDPRQPDPARVGHGAAARPFGMFNK
jgi:hypothetical protein